MNVKELLPDLPEDNLPSVTELETGKHYLVAYDPALVHPRDIRVLCSEMARWGMHSVVVTVNYRLQPDSGGVKLYKLESDDKTTIT